MPFSELPRFNEVRTEINGNTQSCRLGCRVPSAECQPPREPLARALTGLYSTVLLTVDGLWSMVENLIAGL